MSSSVTARGRRTSRATSRGASRRRRARCRGPTACRRSRAAGRCGRSPRARGRWGFASVMSCRRSRPCPVVGRLQPGDDVEQRRLPGAVRPDQAGDVPGLDVERHRRRAPGARRSGRDTSVISSSAIGHASPGSGTRGRVRRRRLAAASSPASSAGWSAPLRAASARASRRSSLLTSRHDALGPATERDAEEAGDRCCQTTTAERAEQRDEQQREPRRGRLELDRSRRTARRSRPRHHRRR